MEAIVFDNKYFWDNDDQYGKTWIDKGYCTYDNADRPDTYVIKSINVNKIRDDIKVLYKTRNKVPTKYKLDRSLYKEWLEALKDIERSI